MTAWNGSSWDLGSALSLDDEHFRLEAGSGRTDLLIPFDWLGIADPAAATLKLVALAKLLLLEPKLLLLDEPSLGLAPIIIKQIFEIIRKINHDNNTTIFLVEQNANQALKLAHRGYVMENGKITITDTAEKLLDNEEVKTAYLGL